MVLVPYYPHPDVVSVRVYTKMRLIEEEVLLLGHAECHRSGLPAPPSEARFVRLSGPNL
jgi:hypothetical protein